MDFEPDPKTEVKVRD